MLDEYSQKLDEYVIEAKVLIKIFDKYLKYPNK